MTGGFRVPEPGDGDRKPSAGEQIDIHIMLCEQTAEALDGQHQDLAARVGDLENVVRLLEQLLLGHSGHRTP